MKRKPDQGGRDRGNEGRGNDARRITDYNVECRSFEKDKICTFERDKNRPCRFKLSGSMANLGGVIKPVKSTKEKLEIVGSQNTIISNQYNTEKYIFYICDDLNCCAAEEFEKIDDDALQRHNVKKKDTRDFTTSIATRAHRGAYEENHSYDDRFDFACNDVTGDAEGAHEDIYFDKESNRYWHEEFEETSRSDQEKWNPTAEIFFYEEDFEFERDDEIKSTTKKFFCEEEDAIRTLDITKAHSTIRSDDVHYFTIRDNDDFYHEDESNFDRISEVESHEMETARNSIHHRKSDPSSYDILYINANQP